MGSADLIVLNAKVAKVDQDFTFAEGIAVTGGRIAAVGANEEIDAFRGHKTEVLDLKGRTVLPGIHDAHIHASLLGGNLAPIAVDISSAKSTADVVRSIGEKAKMLNPGEWVRGIGLDSFTSSKTKDAREPLPARWDLDQVSSQNPVYVGVAPFHGDRKVLLNSLALRMTSITSETLPPPGGEVIRDPINGEPTGFFIGAPAEQMIQGILPLLNREEKRRSIEAVMKKLNSLGITSITEPSLGPGGTGFLGGLWDAETLDLYKELAEEDRLTLRVNVLLLFTSYGAFLAQETYAGISSLSGKIFENLYLRIAGIKLYADGIPPNKTAWMSQEYPGGGNGRLVFPGKDDSERSRAMEEVVDFAHRSGYQVGIHATGDKSIAACIDSFIKAEMRNPKGLRHYIIHGDFVSLEDARRLAKWGLGISVQPALASTFAQFMRYSVGQEKARQFLPLGMLIKNGVHVAGGSDSPVASPDWRSGVQSAILREVGQQNGSEDEKSISLSDAIRMYTLEGAWQDHAEHARGSIEIGKLADFCVLDADIFAVNPENLKDVPIFMTIVGGKVIYQIGQQEE
jgi:predicted amidohydrolase YtcJ